MLILLHTVSKIGMYSLLYNTDLLTLNMFLVKAFSQSAPKETMRLINVYMTPKRRFRDLYLDGVAQYCLPYKLKYLSSKEI